MEDIRLYLDGSNVPAVTVVGGTLANAYNTPADNLRASIFRIGARPLGNQASADMDEVALWNVGFRERPDDCIAATGELQRRGFPPDQLLGAPVLELPMLIASRAAQSRPLRPGCRRPFAVKSSSCRAASA